MLNLASTQTLICSTTSVVVCIFYCIPLGGCSAPLHCMADINTPAAATKSIASFSFMTSCWMIAALLPVPAVCPSVCTAPMKHQDKNGDGDNISSKHQKFATHSRFVMTYFLMKMVNWYLSKESLATNKLSNGDVACARSVCTSSMM
jgi:hypothetical protein